MHKSHHLQKQNESVGIQQEEIYKRYKKAQNVNALLRDQMANGRRMSALFLLTMCINRMHMRSCSSAIQNWIHNVYAFWFQQLSHGEQRRLTTSKLGIKQQNFTSALHLLQYFLAGARVRTMLKLISRWGTRSKRVSAAERALMQVVKRLSTSNVRHVMQTWKRCVISKHHAVQSQQHAEIIMKQRRRDNARAATSMFSKVIGRMWGRSLTATVNTWKANRDVARGQQLSHRCTVMRYVIANLQKREGVNAFKNWQFKYREVCYWERAETLMNKVGRKAVQRIANVTLSDVVAEWSFRQKESSRLQRVLQMLDRVLRRVFGRKLQLHVSDLCQNFKRSKVHELGVLRLKHAFVNQASTEKAIKKIINTIVNGKVINALWTWRQSMIVSTKNARNNRLLKKVGARLLNRDVTIALSGAIQQWRQTQVLQKQFGKSLNVIERRIMLIKHQKLVFAWAELDLKWKAHKATRYADAKHEIEHLSLKSGLQKQQKHNTAFVMMKMTILRMKNRTFSDRITEWRGNALRGNAARRQLLISNDAVAACKFMEASCDARIRTHSQTIAVKWLVSFAHRKRMNLLLREWSASASEWIVISAVTSVSRQKRRGDEIRLAEQYLISFGKEIRRTLLRKKISRWHTDVQLDNERQASLFVEAACDARMRAALQSSGVNRLRCIRFRATNQFKCKALILTWLRNNIRDQERAKASTNMSLRTFKYINRTLQSERIKSLVHLWRNQAKVALLAELLAVNAELGSHALDSGVRMVKQIATRWVKGDVVGCLLEWRKQWRRDKGAKEAEELAMALKLHQVLEDGAKRDRIAMVMRQTLRRTIHRAAAAAVMFWHEGVVVDNFLQEQKQIMDEKNAEVIRRMQNEEESALSRFGGQMQDKLNHMLGLQRVKTTIEFSAAVAVHLYRWRMSAYVEMRPNTWSEAILAKKEATRKARGVVVTLVLARLRGVFSDVVHWQARVLLQRLRQRAASHTARATHIRKIICAASSNEKRQALDQLRVNFEAVQRLSQMTMKDDSQKRIILARSMKMLWHLGERNCVGRRMRDWQRNTSVARVQRVSATIRQLEAGMLEEIEEQKTAAAKSFTEEGEIHDRQSRRVGALHRLIHLMHSWGMLQLGSLVHGWCTAAWQSRVEEMIWHTELLESEVIRIEVEAEHRLAETIRRTDFRAAMSLLRLFMSTRMIRSLLLNWKHLVLGLETVSSAKKKARQAKKKVKQMQTVVNANSELIKKAQHDKASTIMKMSTAMEQTVIQAKQRQAFWVYQAFHRVSEVKTLVSILSRWHSAVWASGIDAKGIDSHRHRATNKLAMAMVSLSWTTDTTRSLIRFAVHSMLKNMKQSQCGMNQLELMSTVDKTHRRSQTNALKRVLWSQHSAHVAYICLLVQEWKLNQHLEIRQQLERTATKWERANVANSERLEELSKLKDRNSILMKQVSSGVKEKDILEAALTQVPIDIEKRVSDERERLQKQFESELEEKQESWKIEVNKMIQSVKDAEERGVETTKVAVERERKHREETVQALLDAKNGMASVEREKHHSDEMGNQMLAKLQEERDLWSDEKAELWQQAVAERVALMEQFEKDRAEINTQHETTLRVQRDDWFEQQKRAAERESQTLVEHKDKVSRIEHQHELERVAWQDKLLEQENDLSQDKAATEKKSATLDAQKKNLEIRVLAGIWQNNCLLKRLDLNTSLKGEHHEKVAQLETQLVLTTAESATALEAKHVEMERAITELKRGFADTEQPRIAKIAALQANEASLKEQVHDLKAKVGQQKTDSAEDQERLKQTLALQLKEATFESESKHYLSAQNSEAELKKAQQVIVDLKESNLRDENLRWEEAEKRREVWHAEEKEIRQLWKEEVDVVKSEMEKLQAGYEDEIRLSLDVSNGEMTELQGKLCDTEGTLKELQHAKEESQVQAEANRSDNEEKQKGMMKEIMELTKQIDEINEAAEVEAKKAKKKLKKAKAEVEEAQRKLEEAKKGAVKLVLDADKAAEEAAGVAHAREAWAWGLCALKEKLGKESALLTVLCINAWRENFFELVPR